MSELLRDLWKSLEQGWEAGAPSLPGPSVGRGLFSNPFLSERDRDVQDLRTLYERVRMSYDQSIFPSEDRLEQALLNIFRAACKEAGVEDYRPAVMRAYLPFAAMLRQEFHAFPGLEGDAFARLTLRDLSELRTFLLRMDAKLRNADDTYDLACRALRVLLAHILEASSDGPQGAEEGALLLQASALESLRDPASEIEFAWQLFFARDLRSAELFTDVRVQLEHNALTTCRVDPSDPNAWTTKVYLPTKAKGRSAEELVADYLGDTPLAELFDASVPIAISDEVRFEHTHILGGSGHGKTQLLLHLIHHDLAREEGPGLIVIDSQGDLIRMLSHLDLFHPSSTLADRLVLIDPSDIEHPFALSLFDVPRDRLASYGPAERERLLNGAVEMYEYVFSSLLGAELTQKQGVIFRFLARLMMVIPGATLHTFLDLMEHGERFRSYMATLDGTARRFFDEEFFHPSFAATKKQIAKRLWGILANPVFERMFSQPSGMLDFFEAMQQRKIILISTAKDVLRQEGAEILGRFLIAKITQAVMERSAVEHHARAPSFIYIDEAQEYVDDHLALLLNQARKYRVGLTLAHQNLDQLPASLRASVMSSTSIKLAGGVSAKDARAIAEDFGADPDFLQSMRKRRGQTQFACMVRNQTPRAVAVSIPLGSVNALPTLSDPEFEGLIETNRARYCTPATAIMPASTTATPSPLAEDEPVLSTIFDAPGSASAAPVVPEARTQPVQASAPAPEETAPTPRPTRPKPDPYVTGQGGRDHKYLQHLLRGAAHERGFKADIELAVIGGAIDVAIEGRGRRIACEVSVTTDADHEAGNVAKGFTADFDEVWLVVANARKRGALAASIQAGLSDGKRERFIALSPEEAIARLDMFAAEMEIKSSSVRGYKVTVRQTPLDPGEVKRKRDAVAGVVARSLNKPKS